MLDVLSHAQRERLAYIDFCLQFFGQISRNDLIRQFKTGLASSSRDFTLYRELAPDNLVLQHQNKQYWRTKHFTPLFTHHAEAVLANLVSGFGDGIATELRASEVCLDAVRLIHPDSNILATLMRAIVQQYALDASYVSLSSGLTNRILIPHAIVNNGHRWHVRAYDCKSCAFRDFVCTRFVELTTSQHKVTSEQTRDKDHCWNQMLTMEIIPHPRQTNPLAIEMDFAMQDGQLRLQARAALAGYLLRQWNVDCSLDRSGDPACLLALKEPASFNQLKSQYPNLRLAPHGVTKPDEINHYALLR